MKLGEPMTANKRLIVGLMAAGLCAIWFMRPASRWAEVTRPAPIPSVAEDRKPTLSRSFQLPSLKGRSAAKPVVAADPDGNVLVVAHGVSNAPLGSDMLLWRSDDRGDTWSLPVNLTNQAQDGEVFFDPWLDTDRRGHFYFVHVLRSDGRPLIRRSKDAGLTWSHALSIPWKWCDRPVLSVSPNGRRLVVAGSIRKKTDQYPSVPLDSSDPDLKRKLQAAFRFSTGIYVSRNQGDSWEKVAAPFEDAHAIPFSIICDDDGMIAASWIVAGNGSRSVVTVTEDHGKTWTKTTLVESLQPDRPHSFNGERFPVLSVDGRLGLHVAYVTAGATALMIQHNSDRKAWSDAKRLSSEAAEEVRMAAIDACGPMVHVTWMEKRGTNWHTYYRGSRDFGETWSSPLCLSETITLPDTTIANGFQISSDDDQSSIHDEGTGRAHAVWTMFGGEVVHAMIDWLPQHERAENAHSPAPGATPVSTEE